MVVQTLQRFRQGCLKTCTVPFIHQTWKWKNSVLTDSHSSGAHSNSLLMKIDIMVMENVMSSQSVSDQAIPLFKCTPTGLFSRKHPRTSFHWVKDLMQAPNFMRSVRPGFTTGPSPTNPPRANAASASDADASRGLGRSEPGGSVWQNDAQRAPTASE